MTGHLVVEVLGPRTGSGLALGSGLVLTAAHVLIPPGESVAAPNGPNSRVAIRLVGDDRKYEAQCLWLQYDGSDRGLDAAILEIDDPSWPDLVMPSVRWGQLRGSAEVRVHAFGFPDATVHAGLAELSPVTGTMHTASGEQSGRPQIVVDGAPERGPRSWWGGLSGGPVFDAPGGVTGDVLLGVVVGDPEIFASRRLRMVPVSAILADEDVAGILSRSQGELAEVAFPAAPQPAGPSSRRRPARVFVDATPDVAEFPKALTYLQAALDGARRAELVVVDGTTSSAGDRLALAASCDAYICVCGFQYGKPVGDADLSITEQAYQQALEAGQRRRIFVLDDETSVPRKLADADPSAVDRLRLRLCDDPTTTTVNLQSPEELTALVMREVMQLGADPPSAATPTDPDRSFAAARAGYIRRLQEMYRRLILDTLTPSEHDDNLPVLLEQVFIPQQARPGPPPLELSKELWRKLAENRELPAADRPEAIEIDRWQRSYAQLHDRAPQPVLDVLADPTSRLTVLLGDPGAGKSTLAQFLALSLTGRGKDSEFWLAHYSGWLPVMVELRTYANLRQDYPSFLDYLDHLHHTDSLGLPQTELDRYLREDGRAWVIFDGLDELFDLRDRETVARQIAGFAGRYPKTRILVTSRSIGYQPRILGDAGFAVHHIQDLDDAQIEAFVTCWYQVAYVDRRSDAAARTSKLLGSINASPSIRELAGNPMLLTILAIIGKRRELPRDRQAVYAYAASVLAERWDIGRHLHDEDIKAEPIDADDKKEMLRRIARRIQATRTGLAGNHIDRAALLAEFETYLTSRYLYPPPKAKTIANAMIRQFHERNFILSLFGAGVYGFVHRAFLEYFCADDIRRRFETTQDLSFTELRDNYFLSRWPDDAWQEVLLLLAGMINAKFTADLLAQVLAARHPTWMLIDGKPPHNLTLTIRAIADARNITPFDTLAHIALTAITELLDTARRQEEPGDSAVEYVEDTLLPAISALGPSWPRRSSYLVWFQSHGPQMVSGDEFVGNNRASIAAALIAASLYPGDRGLLNHLLAQATAGADQAVRQAAIEAIADGWQKDPGVLPFLRERATTDPGEDVRRTAIEAIAAGWHDDPGTLPLLYYRASTDPGEFVRLTAIDAIATGWHDDPGTLPLLYDRATTDPDKFVRRTAIDAIAAGWHDDPGTLPLLYNRATTDTDWFARQTAIRAVGTGWHDNPDTLPWLRHRATTDSSDYTRRTAIEEIISGWHDDPGTLPLLYDRATTDPGWLTRRAAMTGIATGWHDDPGTLPLLHDRATTDPRENTRQAAIEAVAADWRDDPATLPLLYDRAIADPGEICRQAAIGAKAAGWHDDPGTLPWLRERATTDPGENARQAATLAIATGWSDDPGTLPWLRERATTDPGENARQAAIQAIAAGWSDDPGTLPWLRERATTDPGENARQAATLAIATGWHHDPSTLPLLRERATTDQGEDARQAAIQAIAIGWHDDPGTAPWLRERAITDPGGYARQTVIQAIAAGWHDDPATLPLLYDRATTDPASYARQAAITAIAVGWPDDPDTLPWLRERAITDLSENARQAAIEAIAARWPDDPDTLPWLRERAITDLSENARQAAIEAIAARWPDDPGTLPWLRERAITDLSEYTRQAAIEAIAAGWYRDPDALILLRVRATTDGSAVTRQAAIEAIAAGWQFDRGTLPLLRECAATDPSENARQAAIKTIAAGWHGDPGTLSLLREHAATDADATTRQAAIEAIADGWYTDSGTLPYLRERATTDGSDSARQAAIRAIAAFWHDDPDTLTWLRDRATTDPSEYTRQAATEAIATGWHDHSDTLAFLHDRAATDLDWYIRQAAIEAIATRWHDDPATLPLLQNCATTDSSEYARQTAIQAIATGWHDDPATLPLLQNCATTDPGEYARQTAIQAIATGWHDDPATLLLLQNCATTDPGEDVRQAAAQAIATGWHHDPGAQP